MSKSKTHNPKTQSPALVQSLQRVSRQTARDVILQVARYLIPGLKTGNVTIGEAEEILFNLDVLLFCERQLKDPQLSKSIDYGMELENVGQLVDNPHAVRKACEEIERMFPAETSGAARKV